MELRQLRYFVTVVEEANFTRAAERLLVAQPGVSAQIRQLEKEFGQELLDRSGRRVRPTEAGAVVLPFARAALAAVEGARLAVDELAGLVRGRVAVGMVTSMPARTLPDLLAGFHRDHPGVEITLVEGPSEDLVRSVLAGELDMAFAGLAGGPPPGLAVQVLTDEPMVAVVDGDDPPAASGRIALAALRDRPLACLPRGTGLRAVLERACAAAGFTPRVAFEAADPLVLAQLAARGLGIAIVPESLAAAHPDEFHALRFDGDALRGQLVFAWREDRPGSPAARALIGRARAALPDLWVTSGSR
ncbi:LysR family transcriptional regulator [Actinomadura macrotermitis]|uniref:HTH-type transcriptional regulator GltC n=1 Tax=Actinomadura macrotermitis TaxID=2585200 RepID=A0A7K0BWA7_9ACTN|nr:LysR substrate-binding domain-containing protein [Actinomadura macrotermitis]MQY05356.1 HTH-type transcriptional regulator GltC [Actinomadura macrotermitis]